jgi:NAD(P)-dependent dehydrogenase (short-subunit alcohol dehydrogenase family)
MQIRLNPVTLITGAGSGIGAGCAHDFARKAHGGLILADQDESALALVADELDAAGAAPERVSTLAFDASDPDRWRQATDFILSQYGRLDWAVINATAAPASPDSDLVDLRRRIMPQSLDGAVAALRALLPVMRKNTQGGSIVIAASADALNVDSGGASKAGLVQLIQAAAAEGAPDNIRINAIAPGSAQTPSWEAMPWFHDIVRDTGSESAAFNKIAQTKPALARYAAGGDIRRLITMLIVEETPIRGATLVVDGGATL